MDILERLRICGKIWRGVDVDLMKDAADEITNLRAELEAERVDAERYRWLKETCQSSWSESDGEEPVIVHHVSWTTNWRIELDEAVDAARGGK